MHWLPFEISVTISIRASYIYGYIGNTYDKFVVLSIHDFVSASDFWFSNNYATDQLMQAGWELNTLR